MTDADRCAYLDDDQHIRLLHDEHATHRAMLDGLSWLHAQATADPDATMVIYYSGHGWLDQATDRYYLIPHDVKPFDLPGSALAAQEFTSALHRIPARRLLVIIDSCHAEGMATAKDEAAVQLPPGFVQSALPKSLVDNLKHGAGRAVFTSARGAQRSWIRSDQTMSLYTYHLIEALQGAGNLPSDAEVRVSNLMNYLGKAVPASARRLCGAEQTPFLDAATEDFAVALLRGGKGLPAGGWEAVQPEAAATTRQIVQALGKRNVAIGGNISSSTIITGDRNTVGQHSSSGERRTDNQDGGQARHGPEEQL